MVSYLSRLTTFDWIKICGYIIAGLTFLEGPDVLQAFGASDASAAMLSHKIATYVGLLTLISNVIKNPSPFKGTVPVLTTSTSAPTPDTLTTSIAPKG